VLHLTALVLGFLLDQLLGDPPGWPHPVRGLGRLITALEPPLRRLLPERLGGVVLLLLVAGTAGGVTWALLALAAVVHPAAWLVLASILAYLGLAARSLARETHAVLAACDKGDWAEARRRLARIVGRDTADLPPAEIYRACVETVAENTGDGVVAPLFYAALLGPVGLWVFKAVSTLDSMVGYRNARYLRFGWASARADDLASLVPARLTWLLLALAALLTGRRAGAALRIGWRDGRKHPSPNAAWPEAAMAGALGVRLGGPATYQGVPSLKPYLGEAHEPLTADTVREAIRLMLLTAWLALACAVGQAFLPDIFTRQPGKADLRRGDRVAPLRQEIAGPVPDAHVLLVAGQGHEALSALVAPAADVRDREVLQADAARVDRGTLQAVIEVRPSVRAKDVQGAGRPPDLFVFLRLQCLRPLLDRPAHVHALPRRLCHRVPRPDFRLAIGPGRLFGARPRAAGDRMPGHPGPVAAGQADGQGEYHDGVEIAHRVSSGARACVSSIVPVFRVECSRFRPVTVVRAASGARNLCLIVLYGTRAAGLFPSSSPVPVATLTGADDGRG
jgi:adenosylcobinamide-phosphate synthase